ncbi:MAG TPA: hypothetical protein VF009_08985 [Solirubrobacterales bacterium]
MPIEEILVLASSKKLGGRCVAGITRSGEWVRPVSGESHGLFKAECEVEGRWPELLDVVRFGYAERLADPAQPENVLIDGSPWELRKELAREGAYERLAPFFSDGPTLLGNYGKAMSEEDATEGVEASLALIEPSNLSFLLRPPEDTYGKLKPRVTFEFSSTRYELGLTDIPLEEAVRRAGVGEHSPLDLGVDIGGPVLLTASLGETYEGWHYKLAAAVLFLP